MKHSRPTRPVGRTAGQNQNAPRGRSAGGFTVMEVLVAIAIFAMAAIVLAGAYANVLIAYDVVGRGNQTDADLVFARSIILTEPDITKLQQGGDFDTSDNRHGKWSVDIQPTKTADLFTVTLSCEISDPAGGDPQKAVDTFMLLRPTWSIDPAARGQLRDDARARINELQGKKNS